MNNLDKTTMIIVEKYYETCSGFIGWKYRWVIKNAGSWGNSSGSFAESLLPFYNEKFNLIFEYEQSR